ncbi:hypothetical protein, partial [Pseudomonas aeruginosa]|uniref:hypothetical protein n=1 Tax=Pseudomonas aeruginosa TaxID=287 RepID=UPI003D2BCE2A
FSIKSVFFEPQTARPLKTAAYFRPSLNPHLDGQLVVQQSAAQLGWQVYQNFPHRETIFTQLCFGRI